MTEQGLHIRLDGPDGKVASAQIAENLGRMPSEIMPEVWRLIVRWWSEVVMQRQFDEEGGYLGTGWAPLDPDYVDMKVDRGWYASIGKATGQLVEIATAMDHNPNASYTVVDGGWGVIMSLEAPGESGEDYAQHFNEIRKVFGTGVVPIELQWQMGKIVAMALALVFRTSGWAPDNIRNPFPEFPAGQIDEYIDDLVLNAGFAA